MPIPKHFSWRKRLIAWLTWANMNQAVEGESMGWRKWAQRLVGTQRR